MKTVKQRQDKPFLLATAKDLATSLKMATKGTQLSIRVPQHAYKTNTAGWCVDIGNLKKSKIKMQIWLDRFSGYTDRKLYACFTSSEQQSIINITKRVSRNLWPVRTITPNDTNEGKFVVLNKRLGRSEFNVPILEKYKQYTFFGIYDRTRKKTKGVSSHFYATAVAFLDEVARSLPSTRKEDIHRHIYPKCENRKFVDSHLKRERNRYLAVQCKERDGYNCQVCKMSYAKVYGENLFTFCIEAHHIKPLGKQGDKVRTEIDDLITVCANCHRILHQMDGKSGDIKKLKEVMRRQRGANAGR